MIVYCENEKCTWEWKGICQRESVDLEMVGDEAVCMDEMEWDDDERRE